MIAQKDGIDTAHVHTAEDLFKKDEGRLPPSRQNDVFTPCNSKACNMDSWYENECEGTVKHQNCANVI